MRGKKRRCLMSVKLRGDIPVYNTATNTESKVQAVMVRSLREIF
jgi:hypothetical protein